MAAERTTMLPPDLPPPVASAGPRSPSTDVLRMSNAVGLSASPRYNTCMIQAMRAGLRRNSIQHHESLNKYAHGCGCSTITEPARKL